MQKITPFLWFDGQAEEAAMFYTSIFKESRIISTSPMSVTFELAGQTFMALNGGPQFKFTEALSLFVSCDTQDEIDWYWERLSEGGEKSRCGWLKDKFGVSWQVVPPLLGELLNHSNAAVADRVMQAMMGMNKLNICDLKEAASQPA